MNIHQESLRGKDNNREQFKVNSDCVVLAGEAFSNALSVLSQATEVLYKESWPSPPGCLLR